MQLRAVPITKPIVIRRDLHPAHAQVVAKLAQQGFNTERYQKYLARLAPKLIGAEQAVAQAAALNDFAGSWEDWCDQNPGEYGGRVDVCKRDFPGGFLVPFAPWTIAGKQGRIFAAGLPPRAEEYDPENLCTLWLRDPIRYAYLVAISPVAIPALGVGGDVGRWLSAIPLVGQVGDAVYTGSFATPVGWAIAVKVAFDRGEAAQKGTGWDRAYKMLKPVIDAVGDTIWAIASHGISPQAFLIAAAKVESRNEGLPAPIRAILMAVAEVADTLVAVIQDPSKIKDQGTIASIGDAVSKVASAFPDDAVIKAIGLIGKALSTYSDAISAILKNPSDIMAAVDLASLHAIGVKISLIAKNGADALKAAFSPDPDALKALGAIKDALDKLVSALTRIKFPGIDQINNFLKTFGDAFNQIGKQVADGSKAIGQAAAASAASTPSAPATPAPVTIAPAKQPTVTAAAPTKKKGWGGPAAAAAAGFLVGGPVGALIGGGAALLVRKATTK